MRIKGLFYLLLDRITSSFFTEASAEQKIIEKATELLRSDKEWKISEIAHQCGISESRLRKTFKSIMGISPSEYRLNFKLTRAKYLFESTDLRIGEVADLLHFYDAAYFCKIFKQHTGQTPKQFMNNKQL